MIYIAQGRTMHYAANALSRQLRVENTCNYYPTAIFVCQNHVYVSSKQSYMIFARASNCNEYNVMRFCSYFQLDCA